MTRTPREDPVACTLSASEQVSRRRGRWLRLAELALIDKTATAAGVELHYRADPVVLCELRELAGLETECCGFAAWNVTEAGDTIRLNVETERSRAPAVWAMFEETPGRVGRSGRLT